MGELPFLLTALSHLRPRAAPSRCPTTPAASTPAKTKVEFRVTIPLSSISIDPSNANSLDLEIGAIARCGF